MLDTSALRKLRKPTPIKGLHSLGTGDPGRRKPTDASRAEGDRSTMEVFEMTQWERVRADQEQVLREAGELFEQGVELRAELAADPGDLALQARMEHVEFMYDVTMLTAEVLGEALAYLEAPVPF